MIRTSEGERRVVGYLIHPDAFVDVYKERFYKSANYLNCTEIDKKGYHVRESILIEHFSVTEWRGSVYLKGNFRGRGIVAEIRDQVSAGLIEPITLNDFKLKEVE